MSWKARDRKSVTTKATERPSRWVGYKTCSERVMLAASRDAKGAREKSSKSGRSFLRNVETFGCYIRKRIGKVACRRSKIKGDAYFSYLVIDHGRLRAKTGLQVSTLSRLNSYWASELCLLLLTFQTNLMKPIICSFEINILIFDSSDIFWGNNTKCSPKLERRNEWSS